MDSQYDQHEENILNKIDIFGIGISIRFSQKSEHTTRFGGLITLSIYIVMIIQIHIILADLIDSSSPTLLYESKFIDNPTRYYLTPDKFSFAFAIQDFVSEQFIEPSFFKFTLIIHSENEVVDEETKANNIIKVSRPIKLEKCKSDNFLIKEVYSFFEQQNFENLFCIDKSEKDIFIEGQEKQNVYTWLQLLIESCNEDNLCQPKNNSAQILSNFRLVMYYSDNAVIPSNKDNPFKQYGTYQSWVSSLSLSKQVQIKFRDTGILTDQGLFFQDINIEKQLKFSSQQIQTTDKIGDILFDCSIAMERNIYDEYRRSYLRIDKAFSQIGGTFNILFALGALLCKPLSQVDLNRKLINRIFNFEDKDEKSNKTDDSKKPDTQSDKLDKSEKFIEENFNKSNIEKPEESSQRKKAQFQNKADNYHKPNQEEKEGNNLSDIWNQCKLNDKECDKVNEKKREVPDFSKVLTVFEYCTSPDSVNEKFMQKNKMNEKNDVIECESELIDGSTRIKKETKFKSAIYKTFQDIRDRKISYFSRSKDLQQQALQNNIKTTKQKQSEELDTFFKKQSNLISFKSWDHFINFIKINNFCRTRKQKLLQKGIDKLYDQIDIFNLIQKLIEVEKLKHLLLNENQIKLFEFIPKPLLASKESKLQSLSDKVGILFNNQKSLVEKTSDAQEAFSQILNKQSKVSKIDLRLMELLDPQFKSYLNTLDQEDHKNQPIKRASFCLTQQDIFKERVKSIDSNLIENNFNEMGIDSTSENLIKNGLYSKGQRITPAQYIKQIKHNQTNFINICKSESL